ncbi:MAG: RnfABCDGE type electron transport complex subunit D [Acidaminococcaceae bacterium]
MDPIKKPAPLLIVSSSPHIHCGDTVSAAMRDVLLALAPTILAAVWFFRLEALTVILACCLSAIFFEAVCQKLMGRAITVTDCSALLTGLLLALCLPPGFSPILAVFGTFCAIVIGKQVFGGLGSNIFNPAHIGRAILLASMPQQMTTWLAPAPSFLDTLTKSFGTSISSIAGKPAVDSVSSATPLAMLRVSEGLWQKGQDATASLPNLASMFIGNIPGSLGETSVLLILLGGLFLIWRGRIDWRIPFYYILTVFVITGVYGYFRGYTPLFPVYHLFGGGLMIGAFFMATDWATSPLTKRGRIIFALGLGIITALIRLRGGYVEGVCYSILMMNMLTPLIDRYVHNIPFGGGMKKHE